ncbi:MAG TPA: hypothetical protein DDY72_00960 [Verrucomicrobia bacterium]|nr:hypothetical protein [Verrucomicrobiota bacterium]
MDNFFKSVRKHIDRLDINQLRGQYARALEEVVFLDTLISTIAQGILVLNEQGEIVRANPAAHTLLGMAPADALRYLKIPVGRASKSEITLTYPDTRTLEVQTQPMHGPTLVLLRDITAEKARTNAELRAGASHAIHDLARSVAHEIGNPLNAISLNLQLLARDYPTNESIAECRRQVKRLDGIIRDFLQALRPTKLALTAGSLVEPLQNCLETLKNELKERKITVRTDFARSLPMVALDKNQMEQVFFNLLKNALEAMKEGGHLTLSAEADDTSVSVSIQDTGCGMGKEQIAHLFEPYRSTKTNGHGLGLMICSRIVHDHGGSISAESVKNAGTTFTVKLPRLEPRVRQLES